MVISFKDAELEEHLDGKALFGESPSLVAKRDLERFYWLLSQREAQDDLDPKEFKILVSATEYEGFKKPWTIQNLQKQVWSWAELENSDQVANVLEKLGRFSSLQLVNLVDRIEQYRVQKSKARWNLSGEKNASDDTEISFIELEILNLLVQGLSNSAIAAKLSLSKDAVKRDIQKLMKKLEVSDRTEAAVKAVRSKLV